MNKIKIKNKNIFLATAFVLTFVFCLLIISAVDSTSVTRTQYFSPSTGTFDSTYANLMSGTSARGDSGVNPGEEFFDLAVTIPPAGCQPYVVRSDLLEEQNVPVFCQLVSLKVNPGIDITRLERVSIVQKEQNQYISGVGFHPALSAVRSSLSTQFANPTSDNLGYVVVVLKRNENERSMPDNVTATLAIQLEYGANYAYGIGETEFYLPVMTDSEFSNKIHDYSFYDGIGYLRVEDVDETGATISVYDTYGQSNSGLRRVFSDRIEIGKVSRDFYLYSYSGGQGIRISLKEIVIPEVKAKIKVNGQFFEIYKGGKFYNGKCTLNDITAFPGETGSARITCNGKIFDLQKKFNELKLSINGQDAVSFAVGQEITGLSTDTDKFYLVYAGQSSEGDKTPFVLILKLPSSEALKHSATDLSTKLVALNKQIDRDIKNKAGLVDSSRLNGYVSKTSAIGFSGTAKFFKLDASASSQNIDEKTVIFNNLISQDESLGSGANSPSEYFEFAKESYDYVKSSFGAESASNLVGLNSIKSSYSVGEYALWSQYELAKNLNQKETLKIVLSRIENEYPASVWKGQSAHGLLTSAGLLSSEGSTGYDEKNDISVELVSITEPSNEEASVTLSYNGAVIPTLYKGGVIVDNPEIKISLKSFDENRVYLNYVCKDKTTGNFKTSPTNGFAGNGNFIIQDCGATINVQKINLKKVAHIQIIPITHGRSRESNFTFSIGIEKRALALNLTPAEANQKITELNNKIAEWKNITESLSEFIKVEKLACLATTNLIDLMNLISGASGEATARQQVMKKWNAYCGDAANRKNGENVEDCIANNYDEKIKPEIEQTQKILAEYNKLYQTQSKDAANQDEKGRLNDTRVKENVRMQVIGKISNIQFYESNGAKVECKTPYTANEKVDCASYANQILSAENLNYMNYDELSSLYYNLQMAQSDKIQGSSAQQYSAAAYSTLRQLEERSQVRYRNQQGLGELGLTFGDVDTILTGKQTREIVYTGKKFQNLPTNIQQSIRAVDSDTNVTDGTNKISLVKFSDGGIYVYVLGGSETNPYYIAIYKLGNSVVKLINEQGEITEEAKNSKLEAEAKLAKDVRITISDATAYKNKCTNCNEVKVFNTEPYKGMPSLLPFDCNEGWYVQTKQLITGLGTSNQKTFLDSGKVNSFWLCNVGKNGLLESGLGDDKCTRFDMYTGNSLDNIGGLTQAQAKAKVSQAIAAIEKAQSELAKNPTSIDSGSCKNLKVKNAEGDLGNKCTDFMSPDQCQLIFNVCDPVVCPSSRCDLGGTYKVDNVIQSGIIGSTFLCLPNFIGFHPKTGVVIPVCLTGINAGIENWISILEAYRDCINESVTNNRTVGICDAVHSVYVCDFFWRQAGPIVQAISKNLFYSIFGQGDHGGGEYLFVNDAWNNAEKSVQYTQTKYGDDSNLKFGFRDISNAVADQVCKMGASATYPDNFDAMLEPESPFQFTAFFEELPYTDATALARSQYKVTYHIFAGNEQGHYYQVYLKSAPTSLGYVGKERSVVASGYVAKGGTASESKDFLDVSGFKELCVRIDAQDKCGFKSVSTDAALNYAKDAAVSNQATEQITSESTCIAGSSNLGSLLTPNLQQAATDLLNPAIYNQGIIRVCANENPGKAVDPSRWTDMGYCDDRNVRCWLDTQSVRNAIQGRGIENYTLEQVQNLSIQNLIEQQGYLPSDEAQKKINELRNVYLKIVESISSSNPKGKYTDKGKTDVLDMDFEGRTMTNLDEDIRQLDKLLVMSNQRAQLFFIKAEIYDAAAVKTKNYRVEAAKKQEPAASSGTVTPAKADTVIASYDAAGKKISLQIGPRTLYFFVGTNVINYGSSPVGTYLKNTIDMKEAQLKTAGFDAEDIGIIQTQLNGKTLDSLNKANLITETVEADMLARMITGEESTQGEEAMTAAGWVAINRLNENTAEFGGNTLSGVLTKKGAFLGYKESGTFSESSLTIAQNIWDNRANVPTKYNGYLFFVNIKTDDSSSVQQINSKFQDDCDFIEELDYKQVDSTTMFISKTYCEEAHDYAASTF